jgi:hypothetical protein
MSVQCFIGEHQGAAYLAVGILATYGFGLPLFLLAKVKKCLREDQAGDASGTKSIKPVCWDILFKTGSSRPTT